MFPTALGISEATGLPSGPGSAGQLAARVVCRVRCEALPVGSLALSQDNILLFWPGCNHNLYFMDLTPMLPRFYTILYCYPVWGPRSPDTPMCSNYREFHTFSMPSNVCTPLFSPGILLSLLDEHLLFQHSVRIPTRLPPEILRCPFVHT